MAEAASEKTLNDVVEQLKENNNLLDKASIDLAPIHASFNTLQLTAESSLDVLGNILNLMIDDSAAAREAAREAARAAKGGGDDKGAGVKDAKVEEAKAGGFFSKLGAAVMNPMKALGSGLAKMGKGIDCLLYTSPSPRDATLSRMPSSA